MLCVECRYYDEHTTYRDGSHRCKLCESISVIAHDDCRLTRITMSAKSASKVLHDMQKWRRCGTGRMVNPYLFGIAIDVAIRHLRRV